MLAHRAGEVFPRKSAWSATQNRNPPPLSPAVAKDANEADAEQGEAGGFGGGIDTAAGNLSREAEPALRKALASDPSAESKRRIEELLQKMPDSLPAPPPERLRQLHALAVLEYVATPGAKKCLQMLAGGVAGARFTREAKAALERLTRRPPNVP